ncbi:hypothetical protein A8990_10921 [Paenibacillus taihuensis]|uniref:Uncharacterized protein n=1 Tax=Paenibacillus taihuensis TaxID=1156355 RepID=A0A3D9S995_9BACL|nr:hypothetical protein [Paenibacillus taihuensis]REE87376.1 hypothetical protein A8990_10921 [Paenibacillus taihuensis]
MATKGKNPDDNYDQYGAPKSREKDQETEVVDVQTEIVHKEVVKHAHVQHEVVEHEHVKKTIMQNVEMRFNPELEEQFIIRIADSMIRAKEREAELVERNKLAKLAAQRDSLGEAITHADCRIQELRNRIEEANRTIDDAESELGDQDLIKRRAEEKKKLVEETITILKDQAELTKIKPAHIPASTPAPTQQEQAVVADLKLLASGITSIISGNKDNNQLLLEQNRGLLEIYREMMLNLQGPKGMR